MNKIISNNEIFRFNFKNLFYKVDIKEYEMFVDEEELIAANKFTLSSKNLAKRLERSFLEDKKRFEILFKKDFFSNERNFNKALKLLKTSGCFMVATLPQFYEEIEQKSLKKIVEEFGLKKGREIFRILTTPTKQTSLMRRDKDYINLLVKKKMGELTD